MTEDTQETLLEYPPGFTPQEFLNNIISSYFLGFRMKMQQIEKTGSKVWRISQLFTLTETAEEDIYPKEDYMFEFMEDPTTKKTYVTLWVFNPPSIALHERSWEEFCEYASSFKKKDGPDFTEDQIAQTIAEARKDKEGVTLCAFLPNTRDLETQRCLRVLYHSHGIFTFDISTDPEEEFNIHEGCRYIPGLNIMARIRFPKSVRLYKYKSKKVEEI